MTIWNRVETGCMAFFAAVAIVTLSGTVVRAAIIGFEAESGTLGAEFDPAIEDATASGGAYITTDSNSYEGGLSTEQPNSNKWTASYSLTVPTGTYQVYIRGRVGPGDDKDDSFYYAKAFGDADPTGGSTVWQTENGIGGKGVPSYAEGFGAWSSALTSTVESPGGTVQWKIGAREFGFDIDAFAFVTSGQSVTDAELDAAVAASRGELTLFSETVASVTTSNATLTATLGGDDADVTLYWVAGAVVGDPSAFSGWDGTNGSSAVLKDSVVSLVASNLQADTFYSFAFYATNSTSGLEGWSESAATFVTSLGSDQAPVFTSAVPDQISITLGWSDAATHETGFILQRSMNASPSFETVTVVSSNVVSYTDTGLLPDTAYSYRLAATNANNGSATAFSLCTTNVTTLPVQVGGPKETYGTAGEYYYKVASGVSEITIKSWGGGGAGGNSQNQAGGLEGGTAGSGGGAGFAQGTYTVEPNDILVITVGGGGNVSAIQSWGGGGGGASTVYNDELLIVAAGGGGGGGADEDQLSTGGNGGPGGGANGLAGADGTNGPRWGDGGLGGTQSAGGAGGAGTLVGVAGDHLSGGNGGDGRTGADGGGGGGGLNGGGNGGGFDQNGGGGGGSGYYGAGGGGGGDDASGAGGGGGGSAFTGPGVETSTTSGVSTDAGNTADPDYVGNAGRGGTGGLLGAVYGTNGNDGLVVIEVIPPAGTVIVIK